MVGESATVMFDYMRRSCHIVIREAMTIDYLPISDVNISTDADSYNYGYTHGMVVVDSATVMFKCM